MPTLTFPKRHKHADVRSRVQFMQQPNAQEQLQALEKVSAYQRSSFIEKGGWDKMPGEAQAGYTVARACADGLKC